eukprot:scaffold69100_cov29-Phaeocystis_antarctica.AAC.1
MLLAMVRVGARVRVRDSVTVMLLVMPRSQAGWKRGRLVGLHLLPRGAARRAWLWAVPHAPRDLESRSTT